MDKKTIATKLDAAAKKIHDTGTRIGGETGGRVGDAIANTTLARLRSLCDVDCTNPNCDH
jgi:hypothetical protein